SAREAAKKAFLVNRVGDFGFGVGIMLCFMAFGTVSFFGPGVGGMDGLLEKATGPLSPFQQQAMVWIPFLLMLGAFCKSAQFPLYVWLPDAMEGPTPVSALIHAATMVTAGVYMIARCSTLFVGHQTAMWTIAIIGAFTAIFAATIAMRQFDLKKVFAYSTISQLGFMFVGVGVLAPVAGVFHLVTHAFFKALLFLSSGVVMHAMAGELDMRKFSGLKKQLPKTRWLMLIGCSALAGLPVITSGYWSKDEIIAAAGARSALLHGVLLLTAFLTAYYTFRLYFRVFEGPELLPEPSTDAHGHAHQHAGAERSAAPDSPHDVHNGHAANAAHAAHPAHTHHNHEPALMIVPLVILAIGAIFAGALNLPGSHKLGHFLGQSPSFSYGFKLAERTYDEPLLMGDLSHHAVTDPILWGQPPREEHDIDLKPLIIGGLVAIAGILLAYLLHLKDRAAADRLAGRFAPVTRVLDAKYWVDEIYQATIVEPLRTLGRLFFAMDRVVVDGLVWLISFIPQASGFALKLTTQRGYLQGYAVTMLLGVAVILLIVFL
ncbi:MAG: NADH-quinone oxidoreductase subunit L, partial [Tepidisphaeraceae bacterium]